MYKVILLSISLLVFSYSFAQTSYNANNVGQNPKSAKLYLGLQTGLESITGLFGVTCELRAVEKIFIRGGVGIGTWGLKSGFGLRYEPKVENSIGLGVNFNYASGSGGNNIIMRDIETIEGKEDVVMELKSGLTIAPVLSYKWIIFKKSRLFVEAGYAIPLKSKYWEIKDGAALVNKSENAMKMIQPGGISLGLGLQFAL